jgi:aspartyl-tRNA(Asn)/glutamyl-tRNA(Gln) amidotransferase subunit A
LKNAGAVLLGKTNLHEFALGGTSAVSYFGPVHNPWALDRIPGGSSGGSGAATAAGLCFGSLGTDTAGSVRIPASYCGIVGFRPTYGRVSSRGTVPDSWTLDQVGPLCRAVEDTAIMLGAIAGYDELDPASVDVPVPNYGLAFRAEVSKLRLGVPRVPFFEGLDPEVDKATAAAIEVLGKVAADVRDLTSPIVAAPLLEIWTKVAGAESYTYHSHWLAEFPDKYQPATRRRLIAPTNAGVQGENSNLMKASTYLEARRQLDVLRRQIRNVFTNVDLLILPTVPSPPVPIAQGAEPTAVSPRNTAPFAVLGLPALSLPSGFTAAGLPIGLQIVGSPFAESTVLALAHAYERETEWHKRHPKLNLA